MPQTNNNGETFGEWTLAQRGREGSTAGLVVHTTSAKGYAQGWTHPRRRPGWRRLYSAG